MTSFSVKNLSISEIRYYAGSYVLHSSNVRNTAMQWDDASAVCENQRNSVSFRKLVFYNSFTELLFL